MDKTYKQLFLELSKAIELLSEQAYDNDLKKNDEKGATAAKKMRDDFSSLHDKIKADEEISRIDYAHLLIGAIIMTKNLEGNLESTARAIKGYKVDTIPKLNRILDETSTDEEAKKLAEEIFSNI